MRPWARSVLYLFSAVVLETSLPSSTVASASLVIGNMIFVLSVASGIFLHDALGNDVCSEPRTAHTAYRCNGRRTRLLSVSKVGMMLSRLLGTMSSVAPDFLVICTFCLPCPHAPDSLQRDSVSRSVRRLSAIMYARAVGPLFS